MHVSSGHSGPFPGPLGCVAPPCADDDAAPPASPLAAGVPGLSEGEEQPASTSSAAAPSASDVRAADAKRWRVLVSILRCYRERT